MSRQIYLYGFDKLCRITGFTCIKEDQISARFIRAQAQWMLAYLGSTCEVCAVDNRPGLKSDFLESFKSSDFRKWIEFEDQIVREGFIVMKR